MNLKRIVVWLVVSLMVLYVIESPGHAAEVVRGVGSGLAVVATSLVSFVGSVI